MTIKESKELRSAIRKLVYEALETENFSFESEADAKAAETGDNTKSKRAIVLKWLRDPALNCAEIMRELWHPGDKDDEDAKRSYFYKCRDGELNDAGQPYSFTDEDITSLYKIKTSSQE